MTPFRRLLLVVLVGGTLVLWAAIGVTAAAFYRAGSIAVQVNEETTVPIRVAVPALLAEVAVELAPGEWLDEAAHEMEPFLPALRAGWRELSDAPDFVLVDVQDGDDHVVIEKTGRRLVIVVDSDGARFRVAIPMGTVRTLLRKLDRGRSRA